MDTRNRARVAGAATWLAACGLTLLAPGAHAQQDGRLTGVVVTERGGIPVPAAMVALDAGVRVDADEEGMFEFPAVRAGPYRIAAVAPGCHVGLGEVEVRAGEEVRIRLSVPLPQDAEDRLGQWTLGTRSLGESVKSISGDQMRRRHVQTVYDALRIIAPDMVGSSISQSGGTPSLRNRGAPTVSGNAQPLIILDGIPIPQRSLDALATVNVDDLELVEVMRGGAGGWRYGIQGANGVVRVTTRDATGGYAVGTPSRQCAFTFSR